MNDIIIKTDKIIEELKNNSNIIEMIHLKDKINSDKKILKLINNLEIHKNNNEEYKKCKIELYNIPIVKRYIEIQNELDYIIMHFNNKLSSLVDSKVCD